jgi:hypothetical protein
MVEQAIKPDPLAPVWQIIVACTLIEWSNRLAMGMAK